MSCTINNGDEWERASDIGDYLEEQDDEELDHKEVQKYGKLYNSGSKFHNNKSKMDLFRQVVELSKRAKDVKEELDGKRDELKRAMTGVTDKVYDMETGMMASISQKGQRTTSKFDENRFKEDYPELYKKYLVRSTSYSCGGVLTVRKMSKQMLMYFKEYRKYMISGDN